MTDAPPSAPPLSTAAQGSDENSPSSASKSKTRTRFSILAAAARLYRSAQSKETVTDGSAEAETVSVWRNYQTKIRAVGKVSAAFRMTVPDTAQVFSSFLPRMLQQELIENSHMKGLELEFNGGGRSVEAAVMFSDASGFTQLTEKLAQQPNGAEAMCAIMNAYLTEMITTSAQRAPHAQSAARRLHATQQSSRTECIACTRVHERARTRMLAHRR